MADRLAVVLAPLDFVGRGQSALTDFGAGQDSCPENLSTRRLSGTLIGAMGFPEHDVRGVPGTPRPADGKPGKERFRDIRVRRGYGTSASRFAAHTAAQKDCV